MTFRVYTMKTIDDLKYALEKDHRKIACPDREARYKTISFLEDIGYTIANGLDAYLPRDTDFSFPYPGLGPDMQVGCYRSTACGMQNPIPYDTVEALMRSFYLEDEAAFDEDIMVLLGACV